MFEYTALVDAPVQRFTGIVTGSDEPGDEPRMVSAHAAGLAAVEADHVVSRPPAPELPVAPVAPPAPEPVAPVVRKAPPARVVRAFVPLPQPVRSPSPSVVPTLLAIAAAGLSAMWWLRRESHDRGR